ncbi:hypothetical protein F5B22DRAFT_653807 [Xylaria bambusicola]|uniref:uncharacterized protein n=1 Tax=Xylaria bambusicola TaxID=326684 RepID=UPI002007D045|nr:uncharacterized protein F5B22DRAFT_653807 [Xylaria bambusicola]KAI0520867.1 hypothetical protein F5B22DRAFT_653807 [Xylaria bambusicola]
MEIPVGIDQDIEQVFFRRARSLARQAQNAIADSRTWSFEKMIGHGSYGVTMLLSERDLLHDRQRKVVLKLPLVLNGGNQDFAREGETLELLRGHAHIAQLISYIENISDFRRTGGRVRRTIRRVVRAIRNPPAHLFGYLNRLSQNTGPALLLEFIENGDLIGIIERIYFRRFQLPNRILWAWYHCLVSACVAMTYARECSGPRPVREETPQRNHTHLRLVHNDIAARNVMVGERDPTHQAHRHTPKLALIDFGLARSLPENLEREAESRNLYAINCVMLNLINPPLSQEGQPLYPYEFNGILTLARGLFNGRRTSLLDPELRRLLAESFRIGDDGQPFGRPSLQETFERTRIGMLKPTESYRNRVREGDHYLRGSLQRFLYDAPGDWT